MAEQTRVDVTAVTSSAEAIGGLLPPRSVAHERLGPGWASPGSFEAATQLDSSVRARADEVISYAGTLHTELAALRTTLTGVATGLRDTDLDSARRTPALRDRAVVDDG